MTSILGTDVLKTGSGSGTIELRNQFSGMTSASMPAGSVIQTVSEELKSKLTISANGWIDVRDVALTTKGLNSSFMVFVSIGSIGTQGSPSSVAFRIDQDSVEKLVGTPVGNRIGVSFRSSGSSDGEHSNGMGFNGLVTSALAIGASTTFKLQAQRQNAYSVTLNSSYTDTDTSDAYDSRTITTLTIMEIKG